MTCRGVAQLGSENCQWQFGNGLSDESYAFNSEIRGSRNVTAPLACRAATAFEKCDDSEYISSMSGCGAAR